MPSLRTFARKICSLIANSRSSSSSSSFYHKLLSKTSLRVRKGHVAMYVGNECRRYEVPVKNLKFPAFQELIKQSQDDYFDFKIDGPILLASCTTDEFDLLLKQAKKYHHHHQIM